MNVLIVAATRLRGSLLAECIAGGMPVVRTTEVTVEDVAVIAADPERSFDVVLLDHDNPLTERLDLLRSLREWQPHARCVITGVPAQPERVRAEILLRYFEHGADGYVSVDAPCEQLLAVLDSTESEKARPDQALASDLMRRSIRMYNNALDRSYMSIRSEMSDELSPRQREVLALLAEGLTNREIADRLYISVGTVKNHVHAILTTLDVGSRKQASMIYRLMRQKSSGHSSPD